VTSRRSFLLLAAGAAVPGAGAALARLAVPQEVDGDLIVVETVRGVFTIQTYPDEAPLTVAHVLALVQAGFYDGLRVHRASAGLLVQFGDPQTRDPNLRDVWGRGPQASSGTPVGVAEITRKLTHTRGAVGIAHPGNPALADSQIYVTLADRPELDGRYAVFGHVIAGGDVPDQLRIGDLIQRMSVRR
jgi:cyclophilin family peptidyl-prolyl cis-trans isomerase